MSDPEVTDPPVVTDPPTLAEPKVFDEAYVSKLRSEAAEARVKGKQAADDAADAARKELAEQVVKMLGGGTDDEPASVETLTKAIQEKDSSISAKDARIQALSIENALLKCVDKHGGDIDAFTDSESFKKKISALDPSSDEFASQVDAAVKEKVEKDPKFRKAQVASRSGGEAPPSGGTPPGDPDDIDAIRKKRAEERAK